jgi:hypothetical protein
VAGVVHASSMDAFCHKYIKGGTGKPNKGRHQMSKEQRSRKLLCYPTSIALLKGAQYSFLLFISGFVDGALWVRNLIGRLLRAQVVTKILRTGTVIICPSL